MHCFFFLIPSWLHQCCFKSPLSKWLEWMERSQYIGGRRTMSTVGAPSLRSVFFFVLFSLWAEGVPFTELDLGGGHLNFFQITKLWFHSRNILTVSLAACHPPLWFSPPLPTNCPPTYPTFSHHLPLAQYSVPLATVSKVPIPKGWRRGPVMSCMHNSTPVIHGLFSLPLCHCHLSFCRFFNSFYVFLLSCFPHCSFFNPKVMFLHHLITIKFTFDSGIPRFAEVFDLKLSEAPPFYSLAVKRRTVEVPSVHSVHNSPHLLHV